jgi:2-hydroxy-3-oxopropionate reductase
MSEPNMKIAFLGIGLMGFPMARNLLRAGFEVTAWNRGAGKAEALVAFGGQVAPSAANCVEGASCVIAMLSDGKAVGDVLMAQGVAAAMAAGTVFIDMSSIKPAEAVAHAAHLSTLGIDALDAPVSGGTKGADLATLAIMAGGTNAAFASVLPVLTAMGRPTYVGSAGAGQIAKLANQGIVAITIGAVAEALYLAEKAGLAKGALRAALAGGFADSVIFQQHGSRMENNQFEPGGRSAFQLKDLNNLIEAASGLGVTLPLADIQRQRFQSLVSDLGGADLDHSALYLKLRDEQ